MPGGNRIIILRIEKAVPAHPAIQSGTQQTHVEILQVAGGAGRAFDRAIERGVKEPRVFLNRGLARLQLGGLGAAPAALVDIERALKLDPDYALAYFNRAMIFEQAANAGIRLRDALSPELMRAVAEQNIHRACQLGHAGACERLHAKSKEMLPGAADGPVRMTPEVLREQGLPDR